MASPKQSIQNYPYQYLGCDLLSNFWLASATNINAFFYPNSLAL